MSETTKQTHHQQQAPIFANSFPKFPFNTPKLTLHTFFQPNNRPRWSGLNTTTNPPPSHPFPCWNYVACYKDLVDGHTRVLPVRSGPNNETVEGCIAACATQGLGYTVAGVEFGSECFCGTARPDTAIVPNSQCNVTCKGDGNEPCGGDSLIAVYEYKCPPPTSWTSQVSTTPATYTPTTSTSQTSQTSETSVTYTPTTTPVTTTEHSTTSSS
ncbi:hypothetical protein HDU76_010512, partial [Blyttiomyces sp. JEL0837]